VILQVEFWQLVGLVASFLGIVFTIVWGVVKFGLSQFEERLSERFKVQDKRLAEIIKDAAEWRRIERELRDLIAALPHQYVLKQDYIVGQAAIVGRHDALYNKIDSWFTERGPKNA
jgi:hypothetical protein